MITDPHPLDLDKLRVLGTVAARSVLYQYVRELGETILTLCAELEQAQAENAAHVLDVALLSAALDPLRAMPGNES